MDEALTFPNIRKAVEYLNKCGWVITHQELTDAGCEPAINDLIKLGFLSLEAGRPVIMYAVDRVWCKEYLKHEAKRENTNAGANGVLA